MFGAAENIRNRLFQWNGSHFMNKPWDWKPYFWLLCVLALLFWCTIWLIRSTLDHTRRKWTVWRQGKKIQTSKKKWTLCIKTPNSDFKKNFVLSKLLICAYSDVITVKLVHFEVTLSSASPESKLLILILIV